MKTSSYGQRFIDSLVLLSEGLKNKESQIHSTLNSFAAISADKYDKYPLAILRIIRAIWQYLEIHLNCFFGNGNEQDDTDKVLQAVAELERLEEQLEEQLEMYRIQPQ